MRVIALSFWIIFCTIAKGEGGIVLKEDIFEVDKYFNNCHASCILEGKGGELIVVYFGGTKEGNKDVCIWQSKYSGGKWGEPRKIALNIFEGKELACYNPVLFRLKSGRIMLYYKRGRGAKGWEGMQAYSDDDGESWSSPERIKPKGNHGPIKNKPIYVGQRIVSPTSDELEGQDRRVYFWLSEDEGKSWVRTEYANESDGVCGIQPSILVHRNGDLQAVGRTKKGVEFLFETWSKDGGKTWSKLGFSNLPNNNSGTDAITLRDGRHLIVYNHSKAVRHPLNLAMSENGKDWYSLLVLDDKKHELSYPSIIERKNGLVDITYTNKRKVITHIVIDMKKVKVGKKIVGR